MIKIEFSIGGGTKQVAPGTEAFSFPYFETVFGENLYFNDDLHITILGAYRGNATIRFNLVDVNWFEVRDAETDKWISRYDRIHDPHCDIFKLAENRYRITYTFKTPKEPEEWSILGTFEHLSIYEIISVSATLVGIDDFLMLQDCIRWRDNRIEMKSPNKALCDRFIQVIIEYRKK